MTSDTRRRGTTKAEDAQGTPTQSHISPSILVNNGSLLSRQRAARRFTVHESGFVGQGFGWEDHSAVLRSGFGVHGTIFKVRSSGFRVQILSFRV